MYALGIIAGEGCFTIATSHSNGKVYPNPRLVVMLKNNDTDTLNYLQETFNGIGRINNTKSRDTVSWKVRSKEDLKRAKHIIEKQDCKGWQRSEKYKNFKVWAKTVDIYTSGEMTSKNAVKIYKIAKGKLNNEAGQNVNWDSYIEQAKENPYGFICGETKEHSEGKCQRTVSGANETCWNH